MKPTVGLHINFMGHRRTIVAVLPYNGKYTEFFDATLVVTAPFTESGTTQFVYNTSDFERDQLS
jgi:hypothetical protein